MTVDELSQKVNCNLEYALRCVIELHDEHECRRKKRSSEMEDLITCILRVHFLIGK